MSHWAGAPAFIPRPTGKLLVPPPFRHPEPLPGNPDDPFDPIEPIMLVRGCDEDEEPWESDERTVVVTLETIRVPYDVHTAPTVRP